TANLLEVQLLCFLRPEAQEARNSLDRRPPETVGSCPAALARPANARIATNNQVFAALTFSPDVSYLYALVFGGSPEDHAGDGERIGVYRRHVPAVLRGRGKKSGGHLLPDPDFFLPTPAPDVFEWAKFGRPFVAEPDSRTLAAGFWDKRIL